MWRGWPALGGTASASDPRAARPSRSNGRDECENFTGFQNVKLGDSWSSSCSAAVSTRQGQSVLSTAGASTPLSPASSLRALLSAKEGRKHVLWWLATDACEGNPARLAVRGRLRGSGDVAPLRRYFT